jgi:hypothetical protein
LKTRITIAVALVLVSTVAPAAPDWVEMQPGFAYDAHSAVRNLLGYVKVWLGGLKVEVRHLASCKVSPQWELNTRT